MREMRNIRKMQVFIVTRDGRKNIYDVDRFGKVSDLKMRIGRNLNVPMCFSRLAYKGRILPNDCILEDIGVKRMSTLELFWQPLVFSPKQIREKEIELEKLEQKQGSMAEGYDQIFKSGGLLAASQSKGLLHVDSVETFALLPIGKGSMNKMQDSIVADDEDLEDLSSASTDDLEFLAAYRNVSITKTELDIDLESSLELENLPSPIKNLDKDDIGIPDATKLNNKDIIAGLLDGESVENQSEEATCSTNPKKKTKKNRKKK
ncbi:uncharacterized protein [Drosophila tropicalis]|uniref:uncharacterized protein n=1 Tax=Drosophila tropicalis TaxID=46794 RepID=UPI0035ABD8E9